MKYQDLEDLVSEPRLSRYLDACDHSKVKAKKLYKANLKVAQSFYPILNLFEIILRNKIHDRLSTHFENQDWIVAQKTGFMNDATLKPSGFYLKRQVIKTEKKLKARRSRITAGKVIAEQTFGFWTTLFEPHHYRLLRGTIIGCFPKKPAEVNRSTISTKLRRIRDFRNRIYHNEPICFNRNNIDFQTALDIKKEIYDILIWINNEAPNYVQTFDNIDKKILAGSRI